MSIDLLILGNAPIERMFERVKLAEDNGYDTVWLADERFYREVYSCLTYFAQHTSRVKLGPCVTDPYARHPALTAMAIATLDEISNQRAILGIGAGISGFAELGIDRKKPARAIREAIELIRMLLRGEMVTYKGEVIQFSEGKLSFAPVRSEIPIYVASNGPIGQKTAGAVADGAIMEACGNVQEVKARGGRVIAITSRDEESLEGKIDYEFRIPQTIDMLNPVLAAIPLQLLAYYIAAKRGLNVDQPRNLAKSVTVE